MFKNNNVDPAKREDNKNVIRISDYYIRNCSEQECVTVSDEVLEYLISARREERAQRQRDYRHLAFSWRSEAYHFRAYLKGTWQKNYRHKKKQLPELFSRRGSLFIFKYFVCTLQIRNLKAEPSRLSPPK